MGLEREEPSSNALPGFLLPDPIDRKAWEVISWYDLPRWEEADPHGQLGSRAEESILARSAPHSEADRETHIHPQRRHTTWRNGNAAVVTQEGCRVREAAVHSRTR